MMGVTDEIDDEILDSLQKQLFQFLEFDDLVAGGITFKTGCLVTTIQLRNYQEIRDEIASKTMEGEPIRQLGLSWSLNNLCLYLDENSNCQVTNDSCPFQQSAEWHECEIVQDSCRPLNDEWK